MWRDDRPGRALLHRRPPPPHGQIDDSTMRVIAPAYKWVADREPWCVDTTNRAEIGLLSVEAINQKGLSGRPDRKIVADEGAVRVLMEGQFTFDVLDRDSDFSAYRLLILPTRSASTPRSRHSLTPTSPRAAASS